MKAITIDAKNIAYQEGDERLATLTYLKRMSYQATIRLSGGDEYEIRPLDIWRSKFEILHNSKAEIAFNRKWNGKTLIDVIRQGHRQSYIFQPKGFFDYRYVLMDNDKREMAVLRTKFLWKGFKYDFDLQVSDSLKRREEWLLLVVLQTYLSRYIMHQHRKGHGI
ncbi:hypothetical protein TBC1_11669 [Lentimicrobium saccharophilum]|uniref:Uncharacterized protein n=1 Tax=Lentimicrobium saccharophilum TaxID=1678841 RepID=A0A0S7BPR6_9BACT|nr:hypothetical protein [Lentimicrobium saccharophilum]GAP42538.1 hypothetical protein TBC1_11669 [Lentimicrobium saccharophilum]